MFYLKNNLTNSLLTLGLFTYLTYFGYIIKNSINLNSITIGILIYLYSFFVFDLVLTIFGLKVTFINNFYLVNFLWSIIFIFKYKKFKEMSFLILLLFSMQIFSNIFRSFLSLNKNFIGDVSDFQLPNVKNIYENSLYFSINNPTLEGYPQMINYLHALLNKFISFNTDFVYYSSSTNVLFLLTLLLFFEFRFSFNLFLLKFFTFSSLVLNSGWLKFLFLESLMSEGLLSYLVCASLIPLCYKLKEEQNNTSIYYLIFGMLYLSKQFVSTISILILILFLFINSNKKQVVFGFSALVLNELSYLSAFRNLTKNYHFKQFDLKDAIQDILFLRELKFSNLSIILDNLIKDKPLFYLLTILLALLIVNLIKNKKLLENKKLVIYLSALLSNVLLIIILYISIWKNMELESPIRYLLNFLHLYFFTIFELFNRYILLHNSLKE